MRIKQVKTMTHFAHRHCTWEQLKKKYLHIQKNQALVQIIEIRFTIEKKRKTQKITGHSITDQIEYENAVRMSQQNIFDYN